MAKGVTVANVFITLEEIKEHQENIKKLTNLMREIGNVDWFMVLNADLHMLDMLIAFVEAAPDET